MRTAAAKKAAAAGSWLICDDDAVDSCIYLCHVDISYNNAYIKCMNICTVVLCSICKLKQSNWEWLNLHFLLKRYVKYP